MADPILEVRGLTRRFGTPTGRHPFGLRLDGGLRLKALHTPGHTRDSMCVVTDDRVFTGDTLLIGATGRTRPLRSNHA